MIITFSYLFLISGLDDLFIDIYYWLIYWPKQKHSPEIWQDLYTMPEKYIAVMIPCWHESKVIIQMLMNNMYEIEYTNYYLFVGVYPNDPETILAVTSVAINYPRVQCVIGNAAGPTNKAANLNQVYAYILNFEQQLPQPFEIFIFHDSEDIIHPLSLRIYNNYIPSYDMVQTPIFPLNVEYSQLTHWLYADEFAETHTKDIFVRQDINAHVPSAGVGTAFSRTALLLLVDPVTREPFSTESLTEDYRTSLFLRLKKLRPLFAAHIVRRKQWVRCGILGNKYKLKLVQERIATRSLFPKQYIKAVRQKARWIIGIVFQEWDHSLWPKDWRVCYSLLHDRKAFITHFINGFGYVVFLFWISYSCLTYDKAQYPALQEQLNLHTWVYWLMLIVLFMMIERYIQRLIATWRIYGWRPLCLVIPRVLYGNMINLQALLRAYRIYFNVSGKVAKRKPLVWDKTDHDFPGCHVLITYKPRLSTLLLADNYLTAAQLQDVRLQREYTGERLGEILCRLSYIDKKTLRRLLAKQYGLVLINKKYCLTGNQNHQIQYLPHIIKKLLKKQQFYIVSLNIKKKRITLAIIDPTNEWLLTNVLKYLQDYKVVFMLLDDD